MGTSDAFPSGTVVQLLLRDFIMHGIEFLENQSIADIAVFPRSFQELAQLFRCMVDKKPENMDFLVVKGGGDFQSGNGADLFSRGAFKEFGNAGNGVMIRQGDSVKPDFQCVSHELRRRIGTVGSGAVCMQVDHSVFYNPTASIQLSAMRACPGAAGCTPSGVQKDFSRLHAAAAKMPSSGTSASANSSARSRTT